MSDLENNLDNLSEGQKKFFEQIQAEKAKLEPKAEVKAEEVSDSSEVELTDEVQESTEQTSEQREFTEVEKKAMQQGWNPNHKGDSFVSADEFLKRGTFFKKIEAQNQKIQAYSQEMQLLKDTVKELTSHLKKTEEVSYNKALRDIMERRAQAVADGDVEAFNNAEYEAQKLQQELQDRPENNKAPEQPQQVQHTPGEMAFYERNKHWFNKDSEENMQMINEAVIADNLFVKSHPNMPEAERLQKVEDRIKLLYPHRFENKKQEKPPIVGKSTVGITSKGGFAERLSDRQRAIAQQAKNVDPSFDIEKYAKQLDSLGELKK